MWSRLLQVSEHRLGIVGSLNADSHEIVIRPAESSRPDAAGGGPAGAEGEEEEEEEGAEQTWISEKDVWVASWQVLSANCASGGLPVKAGTAASLLSEGEEEEDAGGPSPSVVHLQLMRSPCGVSQEAPPRHKPLEGMRPHMWIRGA